MPPTTAPGGRELRVPASVFATLRAAAREWGTAEELDHVLEQVGRDAGARLAPLATGDDSARSAADFWDRFARTLRSQGWGAVTHRRIHPGISVLECPDCAEGLAAGPVAGGHCPLTTGVLAGLLGASAGRPVEVVQVGHPGVGGDTYRWIFGAPAALERVRAALDSGASLDDALGSA